MDATYKNVLEVQSYKQSLKVQCVFCVLLYPIHDRNPFSCVHFDY